MNEEYVICQNCMGRIQESNFVMHELYCQRNLQTCTTCGNKYDTNEEDEHIQIYHLPHICKYCSLYVADFNQHNCKCKPVICQYCRKSLMMNEIDGHEQGCKKKEKKCNYCSKMIENSELKNHIPKCQIANLGHLEFLCKHCGQKLLSELLQTQHEDVCQLKPFECPYCYFHLSEEEKADHLYICGSRTEKCIFCKRIILLSKRTQHQLDCYRERINRNLQLKKKVSVKQQECGDDADYQAYLEQLENEEDYQQDEY